VSSAVVVTRLPPGEYLRDSVALPPEFGRPSWENRPDVKAIRAGVRQCLDTLNAQTGFRQKLSGRSVFLKPNLVTVYHRMGLVEDDYPESTDPRVIEAIVQWLPADTKGITIVESSGRGVPTRGSFVTAGLDRLARRYGLRLVALEEEPVERIYLPRARVQKEVLIPRILHPLFDGEAALVSLPKMKTNLYTQVTLGFKNAMGLLPYNLRQRNHNWALEQKLVDLLWLFQPDLTLIDGVVGGQGHCPAPVDPIDSRLLVSGTNALETDWTTAGLMGFVPEQIPLLRMARELGFGDDRTEIVGDCSPIPFRRADPSLFSAEFQRLFPRALALVGHQKPMAPVVPVGACLDGAGLRAMESVCRGGCLASTRFAFEMILREGLRCDFRLTVIVGGGAQGRWFDREGKAYRREEIANLTGKKMAVGACTRILASQVDRWVDGCMPFPNAPHTALHQVSGSHCRVFSLKNRRLLPMLWATLQMAWVRRRQILAGECLDVPLATDDQILESRPSSIGNEVSQWVAWPLPPSSRNERQEMLHREWQSLLATFRG
jgi:uncharacterized protein (DUF362 family)